VESQSRYGSTSALQCELANSAQAHASDGLCRTTSQIATFDHIYAVDGEEDFVFCAGGTDTVEADPIDMVDEATCETGNTSTQ